MSKPLPFIALFSLLLLLLNSPPPSATALQLGIGIGIGGGGINIGGGGGSPPQQGSCPPPPRPFIPPFPPAPQMPPPLNQKLLALRQVILRFKRTITCDPQRVTNSWLPNTSPCSYTGFYCGNPPKDRTLTIASVDFNGYGICAPTINGFLDMFSDLALFHANSNNFSGSVPDVSKLQYLYELDLSNNLLKGNFPMTVLRIQDPVFLDIRFNQFSGSVPPQVFTLPLDVLFLNNNGFYYNLPYDIGATPAAYLTLANNRFTGPIPASIKNTSNTLREVLFLNNRLSGCLPYEIGYLKKATVFDAGFNLLTGPIPCSFGCLTSIQQLNLAGNFLYGKIPEEVCELGSLRNLSLSDNYFTEIGPVCQSLVGTILNIDQNCIPGFPKQRSAFECQAFLSKPKYCEPKPYERYPPCKLNGYAAAPARELPAAAKTTVAAPDHSPVYSTLNKRNNHRQL
ncbi:Uncharacterized protein QJS10_CPB13g00384 [Acorus calamus]|uniref:Cell wall hydroxyproline-rich glycoprotein n=1 Tax=Acorus calamus TaxID=4465 RepID=A0AAV9DIS3_ACOCL|nr:Uncharacterized protein QJS10_CPB13g00384 [Acorus calamus]